MDRVSSYFVIGDWGSSVCRLYLCEWQQNQLIVIDRSRGQGIQQTEDFESSFFALYQPWFESYGELPVYLIGAVGSNLGWNLSPYVDCPANLAQVRANTLLFGVRDTQVTILPGLRCQNRHGLPDVLRGEETHVFGYLSQQPNTHEQTLICLPGTHTKWVLCESQQVVSFLTSPVGEIYDTLSQHSSLVNAEHTDAWCKLSFERGLAKGLATDSNLLHALFATRTLQVVDKYTPEQARSFLSGILVGADVKAAMQDFHLFSQVVLIGSQQICQLYASAIHALGIGSQHMTCEKATIAGFQQLMQPNLRRAV